MRSIFTTLLGLASLTFASESMFGLQVESSDNSINGQGLSGLHEGAGIDVLFLGDSSSNYSYDAATEKLYREIQGADLTYNSTFYIYENAAIVGVVGQSDVQFNNDYLEVNGTEDGFYACKNIPFDPYGYSKSSYALAYYNNSAPSGCISVKVKKQSASSVSSSTSATASATSLTTSITAASSTAASSTATISSASVSQHSNAAGDMTVGSLSLLFTFILSVLA